MEMGWIMGLNREKEIFSRVSFIIVNEAQEPDQCLP